MKDGCLGHPRSAFHFHYRQPRQPSHEPPHSSVGAHSTLQTLVTLTRSVEVRGQNFNMETYKINE